MGRRRLNLSLKRDPAVTATRVAGESDKLVYVLVADKRLRYGSKAFAHCLHRDYKKGFEAYHTKRGSQIGCNIEAPGRSNFLRPNYNMYS